MKRAWLISALCSMVYGCVGPGGSTFETKDPPPEFQECASSDEVTFYADTDGDGYGDPTGPTESACETETVPGYVLDNTDCNDAEPLAYSSATELCGDKVDNDCSGADACAGSLFAQWDFADSTGSISTDATGRLLNGILQNGLVNSPTNTLTFDGDDDYVEVLGDGDAFQLSAGTVSLWFNASTIDSNQAVLSKDSDGNDQGGHLSIYLDQGGIVRARLQSNNASYEVTSETPVLANTWHHVAFLFGGNEGMTLLVDGLEAGKDPYTGALIRNREPLVIGAGTDNSGNLTATPINRAFAGQIADVEIYDRQLLQDELTSLRLLTSPVGL